MKRLSEAGLRIKKMKCHFMQTTLDCLGYHIDKTGIYSVAAKVKAVQEAPAPTNVTELLDLSTELEPLCQLLRKNQKWMWNTNRFGHFNDL